MTFRTDIQALRGLAVMQVVLFHACPGFIDAGYLGVDVFFVLSGFLITGMIKSRIERGNFSFSEFYFRRAKRLLPAAYVTFIVTTILSVFLLDSREWKDYTAQLTGGVTFTGNFVLWSQTGYFEGAAALKPLLHIWSLAIEEQYYMLWPAMLTLAPIRFWLPGAALLLIASLASYFALEPSHPSAVFYLLPTRAWELTLGSLAALATLRDVRWVEIALKWLFWPALLGLFLIPVWHFGIVREAMLVIVCFATMIVILRNHDALNTGILSRTFAKIGDFSYSLYLVHWPIFAFINNIYVGDPSLGSPSRTVLAAAGGASVLVAYLLYLIIERPIHQSNIKPSRPLFLSIVTVSVLLAVSPYVIAWFSPVNSSVVVDYALERHDNLGFGKSCDSFHRFSPLKECSNSVKPAVMVWGDSFAMHLVPGIAATTRTGVIQATKSACGPLLGLAQITTGAYTREYAEKCLDFNQSVIDYLAATPSIHVVVLSSPFYPYFDVANRKLLQNLDGQLVEVKPALSVAIETMRRTVERVRALGKRVVIIAPPPSTGFDYTHCLERRATGRTLASTFVNCNMPLAGYHAAKAEVLVFLERIKQEANVNVISFDELLCSKDECVTSLDGLSIYRDDGHFSYQGSRIVAEKMGLGDMIETMSR